MLYVRIPNTPTTSRPRVQAADINLLSSLQERKKGDPIAGYVPAIAPALIFGLLFGAMAALFWVHFFRMGRKFILVSLLSSSPVSPLNVVC